MAALVELDALLGNWKPLSELSDADIALPSVESDCSITKAILKPANETDIVPIPSTLINSNSLPELSITPSLPVQPAAVPAPHAMSPVPLLMGPVLLTATSLSLMPAVCLTSTFLTPGSTKIFPVKAPVTGTAK